jgi:hypothetical protein
MTAPYAKWISTLPCINCGRTGETQAAHMTLSANQKGMGMKVPDDQQVPLCWSCHAYWDGGIDGLHNPFKELDREEKWTLAAEWVRTTKLAATPGADNMDRAFELAELGLGRIVGHDDGGWHWVSCWDDEPTKEP